MRRGRTVHDADDLQPVAKPEVSLIRTALNLSIDSHRARGNQGEEVLLEDIVLIDSVPPAKLHELN